MVLSRETIKLTGQMIAAFLFEVTTSFGVPEPGKQIARRLIILLAAVFYGLNTYTF